MKQGLYQPKTLINIKKIAELKGISYDAKDGLMIGALVTHRELETSTLVKEKFPVLCEAEREVANIRVRNMGTVGGNLASGEPLTDLSQIFIALDAKLKISRAERPAQLAGRRIVPRLLYDQSGGRRNPYTSRSPAAAAEIRHRVHPFLEQLGRRQAVRGRRRAAHIG